MRITDLFKKKMLMSFEVFPPKTEAGMEKLCSEGGVLDRLYELRPDYISCTYGAGGTNVGRNMEVLGKIKRDGKTVPLTHFTCIRNTCESMREQLRSYLDNGINHLLAIRGDFPVGWDGTGGDLNYATELVKFIRKEFGDSFTIAVSGAPEGHVPCRSMKADISFLRQKQDNGADYVMTQLCWDMEQFKYWLGAIRKAGVDLPLDVGVMPVLDAAAVINMSLSRNGCVMPSELSQLISKHWIFPNVFAPTEDEESVRMKKAAFMEEGIEYTIRMIDEYRALGVNGIHLYSLNKTEAVTRIIEESGIVDFV